MVQENKKDVLVEYRDWYKCFKDELFIQPGVTSNMSVSEAAEVVAGSNPYIHKRLDAIKMGESYGMSDVVSLGEKVPELVPFMRLDFTTQDYISYYVSMKDKLFATAAGKHPSINVRERARWCELFLLNEVSRT